MFEPKGGKHRIRNWAPNQVRIQAHDHMQYDTFISYLGMKNNHGMTQLTYGHVTAVKNIHIYIKMAHLITNNAKVSKK
jgi:hypothetical protein